MKNKQQGNGLIVFILLFVAMAWATAVAFNSLINSEKARESTPEGKKQHEAAQVAQQEFHDGLARFPDLQARYAADQQKFFRKELGLEEEVRGRLLACKKNPDAALCYPKKQGASK